MVSVFAGAAAMVMCVALLDFHNRAAQLTLSILLGAGVYIGVTALCAGKAERLRLMASFSRTNAS